ncbi:MAG: ABC transporter ATP-binding protein [Trebonia sp.]
MITAEGLSLTLGGAPVLRDVSLSVRTGQWLGLVGPNGAGKTSLLRCLAHQVRHQGHVRLGGQDVRTLSRRQLARLVAYVPQRPVFPPDMTVTEYVLLGRTPYLGYLASPRTADRRLSTQLLDRLLLGGLSERRLGGLSGGELQRLVLARALAQQAPILLLDEPTSALDLGRRLDALELVDDLRRERELTVVSAVHDLTLAGQFSDVIALMAAGGIVALGPPREVLRVDRLTSVFGAGVDVLVDGGELIIVSRRGRAAASPSDGTDGKRPRNRFDSSLSADDGPAVT